MITQHRECHVAILLLVNRARNITGRIYFFAVDCGNYITRFQSSFGCGTVLGDRGNQNSAILRTEVIGKLFRQTLSADPDPAIGAEREDKVPIAIFREVLEDVAANFRRQNALHAPVTCERNHNFLLRAAATDRQSHGMIGCTFRDQPIEFANARY